MYFFLKYLEKNDKPLMRNIKYLYNYYEINFK